MSTVTLEQLLDTLTVEGELYEKYADGSLTCYACGHRCLIKPGRRGICKVRFNEGGVLKVPWGYVGALQCDPIEKKPFNHVLPGSDILTFGMLGCDFHCPYCFSGATRVPTTTGMETLESLFAQASRVQANHDGEVAIVGGLSVFSHTGQSRLVRAVFRHPYCGEMLKITPAFCPPIECTPDHRFLAIPRPRRGASPQKPAFVQAKFLSQDWCLAIPKSFYSCDTVIDVPQWLGRLATPSRMKRQWSEEFLGKVLDLSTQGYSSRSIAARLNRSAGRVSAVLEKVKSGQSTAEELLRYKGLVFVERDHARLFNEHEPGIPRRVELNEDMAELLGYYCAEGNIWHDTKRRAHSAMLTFSFGLHEEHLANRVVHLLESIFAVKPAIMHRKTSCAVVTYKASLGLLLEALCGAGAQKKRVPAPLFEAHPKVVRAFLSAYVAGDGTHNRQGMIETATASPDLAYGVAWLALRSGAVPSLRVYRNPERGDIAGRKVHRSEEQYRVRWYPHNGKRRCWEDNEFYYIPVRQIEHHLLDGFVYNLEVEKDHTYLPGFVVASNCQNWITSQVLRDPASEMSGAEPMVVTPQKLVAMAKEQGAPLVGSSYNEPLITSEWATAVFKEAVQAGLKCVYISNGNATRETLEYIRPYVTGYKIDLKSMSKKGYQQLGGVLENTLNGIRMVHEMGFWLEVVTLVIPGFNDSAEELWDAARFLAGLSPDIPWHVTAFHKDYKMTDPDNTTARHLLRAAEIGQEAGLRYVYAGNLPGQVGDYEHTFCHNCHAKLIERYGYIITDYRITAQGTCPECGTRIPGVWSEQPETVRRRGPGRPRRVRDRR